MKTFFTAFLLLIAASSYSQCGQIVWADEFDGSSLDLSKWAHENGNGCPELCGWGNNELQTYTSDAENIRIENGLLVIEAVRENQDGSQFTSSKLRTLGIASWTYGRFEARMRLPLGNGLWPAFWMLSENNNWPMTGEIDIMEYRGDKPTETHGTLHYGSAWPNNQWDGNTYTHSSSLADDFHVYAVEWEENEIRWYFDDVLFKTETRDPNSLNPQSTDDPWPWDSNFYMILNLAVGGHFTGSPDASQVELTKPTLEIDYVRVYNSSPGVTAITGPAQVLEMETAIYSVPEMAGATYTWNTGNATIISGAGSSEIQVAWSQEQTAQISVSISGGDCAGEPVILTKDIEIIANDCNQVYTNFDDIEAVTLAHASGTYAEVANPAANHVNSSATVLRYTRSAATQYDVLFLDDVLLMNGNYYENKEFTFEMDIYTTMPAGTPIELQIASTANWQDAWPYGRHSIYTANTSTSGAWETLTFSFSAGADPNRSTYQDNLDRIILLFNPNTTTGDVYYIDNLRKAPLLSDACTAVTGSIKKAADQFAIYPVPADKSVTIEMNDRNITAQAILSDTKGIPLKHFTITGKEELDLSQYTPGVYFLRVSGSSGSSVRKIIIK